LEIVREKATYALQKTFDDFFNFHTGLIFQFPEEAGRRSQKRTLPDLPCQTVFVSDSIAAQRRMELDRYLKVFYFYFYFFLFYFIIFILFLLLPTNFLLEQKIFQLPEKITASSYVMKFMEPKDASAGPAASSTHASSTGFRSSATYTPANGAPRPYREKTLPRPKPQAPTPRQAPPKPPVSKNPAVRNIKS
jgi:hypothetical protein